MDKENVREGSGRFAVRFLLFSLAMVVSILTLTELFQSCSQSENEVLPAGNGQAGPTVILDPGHGGIDGGATDGKTLEKDLNLSVCRVLRDLLEASGVRVVMTRQEDIQLGEESGKSSRKMRDLLARVHLTEQYPEAIFVSIHMNFFPQASCRGMQIYYSVNAPEGKDLAELIRADNAALLQTWNSRACKAAGSNILVLDRIQNPAVLVECGFLSNPQEAALLRDGDYQKAIASVLCGSILHYFSENMQQASC